MKTTVVGTNILCEHSSRFTTTRSPDLRFPSKLLL